MTDKPLTSEEIGELERLAEKLRVTTAQMAKRCSVDMMLWNMHSNACLEAAAALPCLLFSLRCGREEAITEAIKRMDEIGRDWKADGQMQKFYATNYLVEAIRPLMSLSPKDGND